jgi:predicted transposase YbfD/YdcC
VYLICSLDASQASPLDLATWIRAHWAIENRVHHVRDVTRDEDRSHARTGNGPQGMATLRNLAISLPRLAGHPNITAALRTHAWNPARAANFILLTSTDRTLP